ncbi:hypothetical protein [Solirubrobacter soli]|uniref:hypothetical protein n=1 Tax=Solirubrobacter soli TaxID=363832 RepID=UPI000416A0D0|nr:hypothetical protein [Solirubrobacter soli]
MPSALAQEKLAARARRISNLRKRIVASVLAAFVLAWGVVAFDGSMGAETTTVASTGTTATSTDTTTSTDTSSSTASTDTSSQQSSSSQDDGSTMSTSQS